MRQQALISQHGSQQLLHSCLRCFWELRFDTARIESMDKPSRLT